MLILVLIGVYLVFKVTTSYEKLHQDNGRSTEKYAILWDTVKLYKSLEIVVISTQNVNQFARLHNFIRLKTSQDVSRPLGTFVLGGFCIYSERELW